MSTSKDIVLNKEVKNLLKGIATSTEVKENFLQKLEDRKQKIGKKQERLDKLTIEFDKLKMKYKVGGIRVKSAKALRIVRILTKLEAERLKWRESQEILNVAEMGIIDEDDPQFEERLMTRFEQKRADAVSNIRAIFTKWDEVIQEKNARQSFEELRKNTEGEF